MGNNSELIAWSNKLACGVKIIDDQHKGLVDLINEMYNHASGNGLQEHDYFNRVIKEVVNYVKVHFSTEEKIMSATKFPGFADHKKEHETFIRTVVDNIHDYEAGKRHTLSTFARFLRDWVLSHIAMIDKQYFEYFTKIATRNTSGKLSIGVDNVQK